jgi:hypothetical protein
MKKIKRYNQFINERTTLRKWQDMTPDERIKYLVDELGMSEKEAREIESPFVHDLPDEVVDYVQYDFS